MVRVLHRPHPTFFQRPSFIGHVYIFSQHADIFFSSFRCTLCDFHLFARVPQVVCVPLFFFFFSFIYSRCCTFALHKANMLIYPSLPIFFVYLFCLLENLLGLQVTHKVTLTSSGLCFLVPGVLSFSPVSIPPCSRSIALLLIDPDV